MSRHKKRRVRGRQRVGPNNEFTKGVWANEWASELRRGECAYD